MVTNQRELTLEIRTADCYPVLLADTKNQAVAAIHAGWRGTAAGIVPTAVEKMAALYGTHAGNLVVAIGPGIGPCCYEIGREVAQQFAPMLMQNRHGKLYLDLAMANRQQALQLGVAESQIEVNGVCTFCQAEQFYSFRREKEQAGRMRSLIGIA